MANNGSKPNGSVTLGGVTYDIYLRNQAANVNNNNSVWDNNNNNSSVLSNNNATPAAPARSAWGVNPTYGNALKKSGGAKKKKSTRKLRSYKKFAQ